jgi:glutamate-1-semialdehyde 2,1-aminomutase
MVTVFFAKGPIRSWADAKACDTQAFGRWHAAMLGRGVYWPPSQFEAAFVSDAHSDGNIDQTVAVAEQSFGAI